jgi:CDP-paratose 2-epimerase
MKILITGGAGFIGSNLAVYLSKKHTVTVFDSLERPGSDKNAAWIKLTSKNKIKLVTGEISDFSFLKKLVKDQQIIIHLAAQVAVTNSVKDPRRDFEVNILGSFNVLEAVRLAGHKPLIIYSSTNKVYGDIENQPHFVKNPVSESQPLDFYSPYACSKGSADCYIHDYSRIYQIPTVVFRQSCIYGNRQFGSEDQGWVAHFVRLAFQNKPITIYGDGKQIRDLLYIDDLICLFEKVIDNPKKAAGQIFNVGGGQTNAINLLKLISKLEKILDRKIKFTFAGTRPGDQHYYVSDITKAGKVMGWKPKVDVDEGLVKLINWVKVSLK